MNRRDFLSTLGMGAAGAMGASLMSRRGWAAPERKPNIVYILADDLGFECLGCYGGQSYETPRLDQMAKDGVRFNQAYCAPLCSPTRALGLTGRYAFRTGWLDLQAGEQTMDFKKERVLSQHLKDAGYATGCSGKWHLSPDETAALTTSVKDCGFDYGVIWGKQNNSHGGRYWDPLIAENGKLRENTKGQFGPDVFHDACVKFVREQKEKPFFLYYPMVSVHDPLERTPDMGESGGGGKAKKKGGNAGLFAENVKYMDKLVGKLLDELDAHKLLENTLIVFAGDNGTFQQTSKIGDKEVKGGKSKMTDLGSHVPLLAQWKGTAAAGKVCDDLIDFSDLYPTFCEAAGVPMPANLKMDGRSFLPQVKGQKGEPRDWIYVQLRGNKYVRSHKYKLTNKDEFYDMSNAPYDEKLLKPEEMSDEAKAEKKKLQAALDSLKN